MSNPTDTDQPAADDLEQDRVQEATPEGSDFKSDPEDVSPDSGNNPDDEPQGDHPEDEPDVFPRAYVEKLRKENADARAKVKDRDDLAQRLHTALAAADGRLADPTDLPYSEDQLDPEKMGAAIGDLIARKPHLKAIRVKGDAGQGLRGNNVSQVDLLGTLRNLAG